MAGSVDLRCIESALARAGLGPIGAVEVEREVLDGGRSGASLTRLTVVGNDGARRGFVLKTVRPEPWRILLGIDGTEANLWTSGVTRSLPSGLRCPTLDVTRDAETGVWSILMEDVSGGISPRGTYDDHKAQALLRAIARMHARWFERDAELEALGLADFRRNSDPLTVLNVHVAHPERPRESWLDEFARDFWVSPLILPVFLDAIPSADADFFVELCADHSRIAAALAHYPHTLLHGDLRRANIAHVGDDVVLFDWELASRGPAARDLQWYWFLHFWAYPVATAPVRPDRRVGLDAYWDEFARACARPPDRAQFDESCDLAWLSILCQIGFLLADPLTEEAPSAEAIARVKEVSAEAIARARALRDRHLR